MERIKARIAVDPRSGCWNWAGPLRVDGYANLKVAGKMRYVHRVVYSEVVGVIPAGHQVDHLCRNRGCCNPAHLEAVTPRENQRRSESFAGVNARATHCKRGHPFDDENTLLCGGRRRCRACAREQRRAWREAQQ